MIDGQMTLRCLLHGVKMGAKASTTVVDGTDDIDAPMAKKMPAAMIVSGLIAMTVYDAQVDG